MEYIHCGFKWNPKRLLQAMYRYPLYRTNATPGTLTPPPCQARGALMQAETRHP